MPDPNSSSSATPALELAHVLFMDIVAYSQGSMDEQRRLSRRLRAAVADTDEFQSAKSKNALISLPTGDGMALVFFEGPLCPVHCAVQLTANLRVWPDVKVRMGIHTGPVYREHDINAALNVTGGGINMAQRVMDCGDARHILLSHTIAEVLLQLEAWNQFLYDLGEVEVKHGVRLHLYNLYTGEVGNEILPSKVSGLPLLPPSQERVLEAAAPKYSAVGRSTEVVAMVRRTDSGGLRAFLKDEEIPSIQPEDVRDRPFELNFKRDRAGDLQPTDISLRLDSPDFDPPSQTKKLRVPPAGDSQPCLFLLTPRIAGELVVNLELLEDEYVVASRSIRTQVAVEGGVVGPGNSILTIPLMVMVREPETLQLHEPSEDNGGPPGPEPGPPPDESGIREATNLFPQALRDKVETHKEAKRAATKGPKKSMKRSLGPVSRGTHETDRAAHPADVTVTRAVAVSKSVQSGKFLGRYRAITPIGQAGMGVSFKARDEHIERDVFVRILPHHHAADRETIREELRTRLLGICTLNHPNLASVFAFGEEKHFDYLVMEYVPGVDLNVKIAHSPLPQKTTLELGIQLAGGLEAAHRLGVVHRDLKPTNLRITPDGQLKILDFGLAQIFRPGESANSPPKGVIIGTLRYMAPEMLLGKPLDARSDIWAAGAVLYEMATGERAFPDPNLSLLIDAILHRDVVRPSVINPKITPLLENLILKTLDRRPDNRYQSARDLRMDLALLLGKEL